MRVRNTASTVSIYITGRPVTVTKNCIDICKLDLQFPAGIEVVFTSRFIEELKIDVFRLGGLTILFDQNEYGTVRLSGTGPNVRFRTVTNKSLHFHFSPNVT